MFDDVLLLLQRNGFSLFFASLGRIFQGSECIQLLLAAQATVDALPITQDIQLTAIWHPEKGVGNP